MADDIKAIKVVLDASEQVQAVYFPEGTYQITSILINHSTTRAHWVSAGATTILRWDTMVEWVMY